MLPPSGKVSSKEERPWRFGRARPLRGGKPEASAAARWRPSQLAGRVGGAPCTPVPAAAAAEGRRRSAAAAATARAAPPVTSARRRWPAMRGFQHTSGGGREQGMSAALRCKVQMRCEATTPFHPRTALSTPSPLSARHDAAAHTKGCRAQRAGMHGAGSGASSPPTAQHRSSTRRRQATGCGGAPTAARERRMGCGPRGGPWQGMAPDPARSGRLWRPAGKVRQRTADS
jgi:hypothetical protein